MTRDFPTFRREMVRTQLIPRGISNPAVLQAMGQVPREAFVPPDMDEVAYDDSALPIGEKQTISPPYMVALMIEALNPTRNDCVLEIGTGSGYAAAVLSRVAGQVYTVEREAKLARGAQARFCELGYDNIQMHIGDGSLGWCEHAPYDGIVVTAGGPEVPERLMDQLNVDRYLVMPIGALKSTQMLLRIRQKRQEAYRKVNRGTVRFVPLV